MRVSFLPVSAKITPIYNREPQTLSTHIAAIKEHCTGCGKCVGDCAFLTHYDYPGAIVAKFDFSQPQHQQIAYHCSLCGLCSAVCPEELDPCALFLAIRRQCAADGNLDQSPYRAILGYEKVGASALFSWRGIPKGCDTIFFPGCTLPGTRSGATLQIFAQLQRLVPNLGIILDCCAKPSHDLGKMDYFSYHFEKIHRYLVEHGISTVLVACPNCHKVFRSYAIGITVKTIYEFIYQSGCIAEVDIGLDVAVHDPCPMRHETVVQLAVRGLLTTLGVNFAEMRHHGRKTVCCGEGGMVDCAHPRFARSWTDARLHESSGKVLVTYCAGCCGYLNREVSTIHILDLLYRAKDVVKGTETATRAPFTYLHRLLLKMRLIIKLLLAAH